MPAGKYGAGYGLGLIPAGTRLAIAIALITYIQYEYRLAYVEAMLGVDVLLLVLNLRLRFRALFISAVIINFVSIFVGNLAFPPAGCGSQDWLHPCALDNAVLFSLRRTAMLLAGFAWLNSTQAEEMADLTLRVLRPLSRHYPYDRIGLFLFAVFNRMLFEHELLTQSLAIRARNSSASWLQRLRYRFQITYWKLSAVVLRVLSNTPKIAFAIGMHGRLPVNQHAIIRVTQVSAGYEVGTDVIKDINFEAKEGDVIVIRGDPGSGKTTLLRTIARYIPRLNGFARGSVVLGESVWLPSHEELATTLPSLRMVTQDTYEFFLGLTVRQELAMQSSDETDIAAACKQMGIETLLDRDISTLSGGQRIRVILASVLASKTKLLLLDNALSQLDSQARRAFLEGLKIYVEAVRPIVLICDKLEQYFFPIMTRELLLSGGCIVATVPPKVRFSLNRIEGSPSQNRPPIAGLVNAKIDRGGQTIIDHFDFAVRESEVIAVTGPNGAGKTTAMLALAGVLPLSAGRRFGSELVGFSFQAPELQFVALKVSEELAVKGRLSGVPASKVSSFCASELGWLRLEPEAEVLDLKSFDARMLSVSSMLQNTKVLVIDEPTTQISFEELPIFAARLSELRTQGISVIIITHVPEVAGLCDRTVELEMIV
jgi:energy-coupling factor transport system ATP-binding protein